MEKYIEKSKMVFDEALRFNSLEVTYFHRERDPKTGRLLFTIKIDVHYQKAEGPTEDTISEVDYDSYFVRYYPSFPEKVLYFNFPKIESWIDDHKDTDKDLHAYMKQAPFDPSIVDQLITLIKSQPNIEKYYLPDLLLTSIDHQGEIDENHLRLRLGETELEESYDIFESYFLSYLDDGINKLNDFHPWVKEMVYQSCRRMNYKGHFIKVEDPNTLDKIKNSSFEILSFFEQYKQDIGSIFFYEPDWIVVSNKENQMTHLINIDDDED